MKRSIVENCTVCGEVINSVTVEPTGHTEAIDAAVEPDCTNTGLTAGVHCSVCNKVLVRQEVTPALGHAWNGGTVITQQSCSESGEKACVCTACGAESLLSIVPHVWANGVLTIAPTPVSTGEMTYTCAYCGETKTESVVRGIAGDVNEDRVVDMLDIIDMMEWYCSGCIELNIANGEVTGDTTPDMLDIITIMEWYCGGDVSLTNYTEEVVK